MSLVRKMVAALLVAWLAPMCAGAAATAPEVQDMWWGGEDESGWGLSIIQHGETLVCVLYVYDDTAHTTWFIMPGGTWDESRTTYRGAAYYPRALDFNVYDAARFEPGAPYGEITLQFATRDEATLTYTLGPYVGTKRITRQPYGGGAATHVTGVTDLWWGGPSQNGWGVAIVQHGDALLAVWFTYFAPNHLPAWFVMPGGTWTGPTSYEGRIYRPFGSAWLGRNFAATHISAPDNGPFRLTFQDHEHATLEYSILGQYGGTLELTRQPF